MHLSIAELEEIDEKTLPSNTVNVIRILLRAANDWPVPLPGLEDYTRELEKFISNRATKSDLEIALENNDLNKDAWKAESIGELIEVFKFYDKGTSLREIIQDLEKKLNRSVS